jgi:hypothetical protein
MKLFFIMLFMDAAPENKGGGFTEDEKKYIDSSLKQVQSALEGKLSESTKKAIADEMPTQLKALNDFMGEMKTKQTERGEWETKTQQAIDKMLTDLKEINRAGGSAKEAKSFQQAFAEELAANPEHIKGIEGIKKGKPYSIELKGFIDMTNNRVPDTIVSPNGAETKDVGTMTTANVTGDTVITYSSRQAILPAQKVNFRDLIPTVRSETGLYVHFKESGSEGAIGVQTEGSDKSQIDYDFTEVKTVNKYIAGWTKYSKQLQRSLPFLQNTLPRLLLRDFYKKENRYFYDQVATAFASGGGSATTSETDDVKQLIDWIANQHQAEFMASYALLSYKAMAALNKLLYTNGYYQGSGGVLSQQDGSIRISGVPVIPVTWVPSNDKVLIFDTDYMERVEVESVNVQFSFEDDKNFQQNLITARIECYEEINPMLSSSIIIGDFGNSASS